MSRIPSKSESRNVRRRDHRMGPDLQPSEPRDDVMTTGIGGPDIKQFEEGELCNIRYSLDPSLDSRRSSCRSHKNIHSISIIISEEHSDTLLPSFMNLLSFTNCLVDGP